VKLLSFISLATIMLALAACETQPEAVAPTAPWIAATTTFTPGTPPPDSLVDRYRTVARTIIDYAHDDRGAYEKLSTLTTTIGHRLSGSPELDKAIAWAAQTMKDDGLDVHTEKVMIPHWVRGAESAAIVASVAGTTPHPLHLIGLGGSVATPKGGITAPLVVVHDWKELEAKGDAAKGAIVLFNTPMPPYNDTDGPGYGKAVAYRWAGPSAAAKHGAIGMLIRSVTERSLSTPHTGSTGYADGVPKIPAAALTIEDAELLDRLSQRGPVSVHLELDEQQLPDVESANVIGDLRGSDKPDEIVVIGGHIDSWDVGQGAQDDGGGITMMMEVLRVLKQLHLQPHRTIRAVMFVNEENGVRGGKAYAEAHKDELAKTVMALESDSGAFAPQGFVVGHVDKDATQRVLDRVAAIATLLGSIRATRVRARGETGTDVDPMKPAGVPQLGLWVDMRHYFDYHHTEADTLDKVDPQELADCVAAVAVLAYVVADMPDRLDSK
jgi:carboxypeptidase Q